MDYVSFGNTKESVSAVGLGGEGVLRTHFRQEEARAVIEKALELGIRYYDCAMAYADSELYYGSIWKDNGDLRQQVFQTSKSASRDKKGAATDLENSLRRLGTDYLDLWQIHDVRTWEDLAVIEGPGGALEAFVAAREAGKVRYIGVTGHHDPEILARAVSTWPVDSVLLPVNPVEEVIGGFLTRTLDAARAENIAVIGMKVLGAGHYILPQLGVDAQDLIRYACSLGITLPIVGCSTAGEVEDLVGAKALPPYDYLQRAALVARFEPFATKLAFYRGNI